MTQYDIDFLLQKYRNINKEYLNKKYNRLTINDIGIQTMIDIHSKTNKWRVYFDCICECGNTKTIAKNSVIKGKTKSCGCLARETTIQFNKTTKSKDVRIVMENGIEGKLCTKCNEFVDVNNFYTINGRLQAWCKRCNYERNASIQTLCQVCNKTFNTTKQQQSRNDVNLCSMECRNVWLSKTRLGVCNLTQANKDNISKLAKERFQNKQNHPMYGREHSKESRKLMSEIQTKIAKRGKDHPNYNHNISLEERETQRRYDNYRSWRKKVYERDNYTCQLCKKPSDGDIVAHHLDGYNWCKEKRTMVDNGVTLCENCHISFHKKYGNGNNTREQWEEFVHDYKRKPTTI